MTARPERDDSLAYFLSALIALFPAGKLAVELAGHQVPTVWIVFACLGSWTGLYMSLGHLYELARLIAARRARQGSGQ